MKKLSLAVLLAAAVFAAPAQAQRGATPFFLEAHGGLAFPRGEFTLEEADGSGGLKTGITYGINATFQLFPLLGVYGGYAESGFEVEDEDGTDLTDRGYSAGVRVGVPLPLVNPFVKAGAVYNQLKVNLTDGSTRTGTASDRAIGFEVGGGLGIALGPRLSIVPQVMYSRYTAEFERFGVDEEAVEQEVEHLRAEVGLRLRM